MSADQLLDGPGYLASPVTDARRLEAEHLPVGEAPSTSLPVESVSLGLDASAVSTLGPAAMFVAGVGVIAWDYALRPPVPTNYLWFWTGIALCLAGVLAAGLRRGARDWEHMLELGAFGAALYLPYFLRSPGRLIFTDELYHYQVVQLMSESGHTHVPVTLYPIPGAFPGLELSTLTLMAAAGLPLEVAARIIPLLAHMLIPVLAYLVARRFDLDRRVGFVAALVYMSNTSYYFFHSIFAYETLGIVLVLSFWVLLAGHARRDYRRSGLALMLLVLVAITATHHISSYLLALSLVIAWGTGFRGRVFGAGAPGEAARQRRSAERSWLAHSGTGVLALVSILLGAGWLLLEARLAGPYLSRSILARVQATLRILQFEQHGARQLFWKSTLPALERLVDYLYAPLLLVLALAGLYLVLGNGRWRRVPPLLLAFALFGPVMWMGIAPLILTPSSEAAYRAWPFLFVGMGVYCAYPVLAAGNWLSNRLGSCTGYVGTFALVGILIAGGISVGDNQAGRFQTAHPTKAAGPEDMTTDLVSAAQWLDDTAGRYHTMVGDGASQVAFATYGFQRAHTWGNWIPFLDQRPKQVSRYLRTSGTEYIVVDRRITQLLPRYQYYFGQAEMYAKHGPGYRFDRPFPTQLIRKFDQVSNLDRVYDNGTIRIYRAVRPWSASR